MKTNGKYDLVQNTKKPVKIIIAMINEVKLNTNNSYFGFSSAQATFSNEEIEEGDFRFKKQPSSSLTHFMSLI